LIVPRRNYTAQTPNNASENGNLPIPTMSVPSSRDGRLQRKPTTSSPTQISASDMTLVGLLLLLLPVEGRRISAGWKWRGERWWKASTRQLKEWGQGKIHNELEISGTIELYNPFLWLDLPLIWSLIPINIRAI
jgi:hypothetical protein